MKQRTSRRIEADAFHWSSLTATQRYAITHVAELLLDALDDLDKGLAESGTGIVSRRASQIAFVDGDRGTGKTSVLLFLRALAMRATGPLGEASQAVRDLDGQFGRVLVLETLDLETVGPDDLLLVSILARLELLLEEWQRTEVGRMTSVLDELSGFEAVADALSRLQTAAVLASSPMAQITSNLDVRAVEVRRQARARLQLVERLGELLNKLAATLPRGGSGAANPLFVVPVDDFDLAPRLCLNFLRLVRSMTTPRLFFVVAGNVRVAEAVLRLASEGELAEVVGHRPTQDELIAAKAHEIAMSNLRKLIPPQQRARLERMSNESALDLRSEPNAVSLREILSEIRFERNNAAPEKKAISLFEFICPSGTRSRYRGTDWLRVTPRQVVDRAANLRRHANVDDRWGEELLPAIIADYRQQIDEESLLDRPVAERILDAFPRERPIVLDVHSVFHVELDRRGNGYLEQGQVVLRRYRFRDERWSITERESHASVPERLVSATVLVHDLATALWGEHLKTNSLAIDPERAHFDVTWKIPGGNYQAPWVSPAWWTFREHHRFSGHIEEHATVEPSLESAWEHWLASVLEVLFDRPPEKRRRERLEQIEEGIQRLAQERPDRNARGYLRRDSLASIASVLSPECGTLGWSVMDQRPSALYPFDGPSIFELIDGEARETLTRVLDAVLGAAREDRELADLVVQKRERFYREVSRRTEYYSVQNWLLGMMSSPVAVIEEQVQRLQDRGGRNKENDHLESFLQKLVNLRSFLLRRRESSPAHHIKTDIETLTRIIDDFDAGSFEDESFFGLALYGEKYRPWVKAAILHPMNWREGGRLTPGGRS